MENSKTLDGMCQSCMMPFTKDPKGAAREHADYCSYCFTNGKLCYEGTDVREFKKAMVDAIVVRGEPRWKAHIFAFMSGFAPRWKKDSKLGKHFAHHAQQCTDDAK